jgi:hypothetical protein
LYVLKLAFFDLFIEDFFTALPLPIDVFLITGSGRQVPVVDFAMLYLPNI